MCQQRLRLPPRLLPADALPRFFRKQAAAAAAAEQQTAEERAAAAAKAEAAAAEKKAPVPWGKFLARCEAHTGQGGAGGAWVSDRA